MLLQKSLMLLVVHCGFTTLGGQKEHPLQGPMVEIHEREYIVYAVKLQTAFLFHSSLYSSLLSPQLCSWEHWNKPDVGTLGKSVDLY